MVRGMDNLVAVTNDLFDVVNRLKSVDEHYSVFYNKSSGKYEVHHSAQKGGSLAFVVPFDELDCRTVEYAQKTSQKYMRQIFAEAEKQNAEVEIAERKKSADKILARAEKTLAGGLEVQGES